MMRFYDIDWIRVRHNPILICAFVLTFHAVGAQDLSTSLPDDQLELERTDVSQGAEMPQASLTVTPQTFESESIATPAIPSRCDSVINTELFNEYVRLGSNTSHSAVHSWACSRNYHEVSDNLSASAKIKLFGGSISRSKFEKWRSENCSDYSASKYNSTYRYMAQKVVSGDPIEAWLQCMLNKSESIECLASPYGADKISFRLLWTTRDKELPKVKSSYLSGGIAIKGNPPTGTLFKTGSTIDIGETSQIIERPKDEDVLMNLDLRHRDRYTYSCEAFVPSNKKLHELGEKSRIQGLKNTLNQKSDRYDERIWAEYMKPGTSPKYIRFKNNCHVEVYVAVHYKDIAGDWVTQGWWRIEPTDTAGPIGFVHVQSPYAWYYAKNTKNSLYWRGSDKNSKDVSVSSFRFMKLHTDKGPLPNERVESFRRFALGSETYTSTMKTLTCNKE